jgi:hypothetical protein
MIVLSFDLDASGRPVVELYASVSRPMATAMESAGEMPPRPVVIRALVDTGASRSLVQSSIPRSLELDPVGIDYLNTASTGGTPIACPVYSINLFFAGVPNGTLDSDLRVVEIEDLSGLGVDMLLGRDVLDRCLLVYTGPESRFTLVFGAQLAS